MFADGKMVTAKSDISAVTVDVRMDMTANCRHIGFQVVKVTAFCRHNALPFPPNGVPAPFQRRCLAHSPVEVMAEYLIRTVIQLLGAKKEAGT